MEKKNNQPRRLFSNSSSEYDHNHSQVQISAPTLIIYGSKDPYMNFNLLDSALVYLPDGSEQQMIEGGSHIMMYEKNCYQDFQNRIVSFLEK